MVCVCGLRCVVCGWCVGGEEWWWGGWVGGGWVGGGCVSVDFELCLWLIVLCGKHSQAESVAGAAHLPIDYAGVLNVTRMRTRISSGPKL